jgi:hypothetical protein
MVAHMRVSEDPDHKDWNYLKFSKRTRIDWAPRQDDDPDESVKTFELRFLVSCASYMLMMYANAHKFWDSHAKHIIFLY